MGGPDERRYSGVVDGAIFHRQYLWIDKADRDHIPKYVGQMRVGATNLKEGYMTFTSRDWAVKGSAGQS